MRVIGWASADLSWGLHGECAPEGARRGRKREIQVWAELDCSPARRWSTWGGSDGPAARCWSGCWGRFPAGSTSASSSTCPGPCSHTRSAAAAGSGSPTVRSGPSRGRARLRWLVRDQVLDRLADLRLRVARQRRVPELLALARGRGAGTAFAGEVREYQRGYGRIYRAVAEVSGSPVDRGREQGAGTRPRAGLLREAPRSRLLPEHGQPGARPPRGRLLLVAAQHRAAAGGVDGTADVVDRDPPVRGAVGGPPDRDGPGRDGRAASVGAGCATRTWWPTRAARCATSPSGLSLPVPDGGLDHVAEHSVTLGPSHGLSGNPSRFTPREHRADAGRRVAARAATPGAPAGHGGHPAVAGGLRLPTVRPDARGLDPSRERRESA